MDEEKKKKKLTPPFTFSDFQILKISCAVLQHCSVRVCMICIQITKQHVQSHIYCLFIFRQQVCSVFLQKQASLRNVNIFILKCARWLHTPLTFLPCEKTTPLSFAVDLNFAMSFWNILRC